MHYGTWMRLYIVQPAAYMPPCWALASILMGASVGAAMGVFVLAEALRRRVVAE